jgi:anti-sigma factor RsiW
VVSLSTRRSGSLLAAQLSVDHTRCFRLFVPPNAPDVDARQVEAMLAEQYGWNMHVPPSSPADGVRLVGARRCLYGDGTLPHVMYDVDGHHMSLYLIDGVARTAEDHRTFGHHSRIWSRGAKTYVLVTPGEDATLAAAARYVMREAD